MPGGFMGVVGTRSAVWKPIVAALLVALLVAGASYWAVQHFAQRPDEAKPEAPGYFEDVTTGSGVDHTYHNGEEAGHNTIFESLGGGVALIDYDGDGLLDIFVTGGGYFDGLEKKEIRGLPCKLYRNLGGFKFQDVTQQVGLDK